MAKQEVTGMTPDGKEELREDFQGSNASDHYEFEERYCLRQIAYQPDEYDGPERFCQKTAQGSANDYRCHTHENWATPQGADVLDTLGNMKHGMYATDEHLLEDMEEDEEKLYNEVLSWAETYYIDPEEDPSVWDDLQMLAVERVRAYRTSKWVLEKGETRKQPVFDAEGRIVDEEDAPNAISEEHRRLKNLVMSLKRDLGLTRKERLKQDNMDDISESAESLSDTMQELVTEQEEEYDPDEYEFDPDEQD